MACEWLSINRGRSTQYSKLISEFFAEDKRSREHLLAFSESCEISDIYELWEASIKNFPGLERKIKAVFSKGPILREDENPDESTNKPRNDAFVYLLAGKLIRAGIKVVAVEGIVAQGVSCHQDADITFDYRGSTIDIQCKRPQTQTALTEHVKKARRQLSRTNRQGQMGIIAIDCSPFIRPPEQLLGADSAEDAERSLGCSLEKTIIPKAKAPLGAAILGFLVFARAPAMIQEERSSIVSPRGNPVTYIRPDCISTWLAVPNPKASSSNALRFAFEQLRGAIHSR
jgi:hypothetical protein